MQRLFVKPTTLLVLVLVGLTVSLRAAPTAPNASFSRPVDPSKFHIFLLMGQSNMTGYGGVVPSDPYQPGDKDPVAGVWVLDGQGTTNDAKPLEPIAWRAGSHRLHLRQDTSQFGLGMDFAKAYLKSHPGVTVGLIPCGWGGAPIDDIKKGTPLFVNAIARMQVARKVGVIHGVLWHQGESDTVTPALVDSYETKLRTLMADVRQEAGNSRLPFVIGNLAEFYGVNPGHGSRIALINQLRGTLYKVGTEDPAAAFVPSTGLASCDSNYVHFDRASYILFGQRYAEALTALQHRQVDRNAATKRN